MFLKRSLLVTALALLAYPAQRGWAAPLSLAHCLSLIQTSSVQVAQSVVNEAKSKAALAEANHSVLPQLVGQANGLISSDLPGQSSDANKAVIRLEQGSLLFGSTWRLRTQRELELEAAQFSKLESLQDVEFLVKTLYFSVLRDQDTIKNLNAVEEELKKLSMTVTPKFQIGRAPSFDLVKVRSAVYDLARARELLFAQLMSEKTQLAQITGMAPQSLELAPLTKMPSLPGQIGNENGIMNSLVSFNPTLQGLSKAIDASQAAAKVSRASRLPSLTAAVEYGLIGQTPQTTAQGWTASAQLRLTLFDWGLISSQVAQAEASVLLAQKRLEAETQKATSDLIQTKSLAQAHLDDEKRLIALLPELKRSAVASVDRYRRSAITIIEATDAISLWFQNLNNERAAYYSYLSDLARLERLTGKKTQVEYE